MTDSSTGGYLSASATPAPLEDAELNAFLQQVLVGITALAGEYVRPRWQVVPPNQPEVTTNWLAFGIQNRSGDTFAYEIHDHAGNDGNGQDIVNRNESLDIACSFYGPAASGYAARLREGLSVPQNREALQTAGMALIECTNILSIPALINNKWYYRADMTIRLRRAITRIYPVLHLVSSGITLNTDVGINQNIEVTENL